MGLFSKLLRGAMKPPNSKSKLRSSRLTKQQAEDQLKSTISSDLAENISTINQLFSDITGLIMRAVVLKSNQQAILIYFHDLTNSDYIQQAILKPLLQNFEENMDIWTASTTIGHIQKVQNWQEIEQALLEGYSVLFIEHESWALILDSKKPPHRAIQEPQAESSLLGSHLGFVELASQNIALIKRYIQSRELKVKQYTVGERSRTRIYLLYLADVAHPEVLEEFESRLQQIKIDTILNTGELEELIEDNSFTPFPQFLLTERPDSVASQLLQGRFAVVVDRSSSALIGPMGLTSYLQTVDDYNMRWMVATAIRLLRYIGLVIAIFLPSMYIATISYHYEIMPINLVISVGESRSRVPFPPILEALMMEIALEMLREAGLRLPAPIGQTVGIVGGIVIGQAAVQAAIVSNIMVIIVAITAISSFIIPNQPMAAAVRLIRFPMMIIAYFYGMIGIIFGILILLAHLISLESLGTPYGSPLFPIKISDWKDMFIRMPLWKMKKRPVSTRPTQSDRQ